MQDFKSFSYHPLSCIPGMVILVPLIVVHAPGYLFKFAFVTEYL